MPEEFRLWKEKVDALEKKMSDEKAEAKANNNGVTPAQNSLLSATNTAASGGHAPLSKSSSTQNLSKTRSEDAMPALETAKPLYASQAEATEAFKELLAHKNISTIAKMKEVQEQCQHDVRWEALKTMGERKQALAEYQVTTHYNIYAASHFITYYCTLSILLDKEAEA